MSTECLIGWRGLARALATIALCITASAQRAGQHGGFTVSLRDDIREGRGPIAAGSLADGGTIQVDLARASAIQLTFEVKPYTGADPRAVIPAFRDMKKSVRVAGTPGRLVEIRLAPSPSQGKGSLRGGAVIRGVIGADGSFVVELPDELDTRGLSAQVAVIQDGTVTAIIDLDEAAEEAFASWSLLGSLAAPSRAGSRTELHRLQQGKGHVR